MTYMEGHPSRCWILVWAGTYSGAGGRLYDLFALKQRYHVCLRLTCTNIVVIAVNPHLLAVQGYNDNVGKQ